MPQELPPQILTIAGSDSGGGAGVQADLKTITVLGGYGTSAITALTAQNTRHVLGLHPVPPDFVSLQIQAVAEDIGIDAAKTGMLHSTTIIEDVVHSIERHNITNLVVDPVMVAKGGARLLESDAEHTLRTNLLPLASLVTPNLPEAEVLCGFPIKSIDRMRDAARAISDLGPSAVLIKGGHLDREPTDVFYDGESFDELEFARITTTNTHGTGCTYSAAIATFLGFGLPLHQAVRNARDKLQNAIKKALPLGSGHGPLNHRAMWRENKKP